MPIDIENLATSNRRIMLIPRAPTNTVQVTHSDNPTILVHEDNSVTFCLSPIPEISCAGAISESDCMDIAGPVDIYLDGVLIQSDINAEDMIEYFYDHPVISAVECHSDQCANSTDSIRFRIKFASDYSNDPTNLVITDIKSGDILLSWNVSLGGLFDSLNVDTENWTYVDKQVGLLHNEYFFTIVNVGWITRMIDITIEYRGSGTNTLEIIDEVNGPVSTPKRTADAIVNDSMNSIIACLSPRSRADLGDGYLIQEPDGGNITTHDDSDILY